MQPLLEQFVFPLVCLTEDEIELFVDDPPEFARTHFGGASLSHSSLSLRL